MNVAIRERAEPGDRERGEEAVHAGDAAAQDAQPVQRSAHGSEAAGGGEG